MIRKHCKMVLSFAAAILSFFAFADRASVKAAMKFATGGDVTRFRYTDASGIGYTAFLHTFTNTAAAAEFQNMSGKTLPVRLLVVGGGGAGMDGWKGEPSKWVYGGGGGGGGGVTETNALVSAGDVWTIRVGAGGSITGHSYKVARGEAGASSVSNGVEELVLTPGGGAGGSRVSSDTGGFYPTAGAAGGGGSGGETNADRNGATGTYTSSTLFAGELGVENPTGGKGGSKSYGGGGGGAGANGNAAAGGVGLKSDITGEAVVYGSGGGGGGFCRGESISAGGLGGKNAGAGGTYEVVDTVTNICRATAPVANTGSGGAGGISFGEDEYSAFDATYSYGTSGADGVVIIRYDIPDTPCVGGDVVTVTTNGYRATYIHMFTNTTTVATFTPSVAFDGTSVRMLVVGGGGAGGDGVRWESGSNVYTGGGGGGGGGVTETNALLSVGDVWTIRVGAGGSITNHRYTVARGVAGASSVSNGVVELVLAKGGGAGGSRASSNSNLPPTAGAAGGGGSGKSGDASYDGAQGNYKSMVFSSSGIPETPEGAPFSGANGTKDSYGGGGGGAGSSGSKATGGAGLASDITGESVFYGAGGGAGGCFRVDKSIEANGGNGGSATAGNGGKGAVSDGNLTITPATANPPAPNTGSGGGGGVSFGGSANDGDHVGELAWGTSGADGVVIIRYEVDLPRHQGLIIVFQ